MENWARAHSPGIDMSYSWENNPDPQYNMHSATERSRGGFANAPTVNSWLVDGDPGMGQCCTGNGSRTVGLVWNNIATLSGAPGSYVLKVNLALNRVAPAYEVLSYVPYEGKVRVKARQALEQAWVRIPGGFTSGVSARIVGGSSRSIVGWSGRYAKFGALTQNQVLEVSFPNPTTTEQVTVHGQDLTITKRGNTVVSLVPEGDVCGLYHDRARMRTLTQAPTVPKARWVSSEPDLFTQRDASWKLPAVFVESPGYNSGWVDDDGERIWVKFTGDKVLDGDQSHKSRWSATGDGKYTLYDFGRSYDLKYLSVASPEFVEGHQVVRRIEVQLSNDRINWVTACNRTTSGIANALEAIRCDGKSGRYVKVIGHGNSAGMDNDLTEIEFWGTATASLVDLSFPNPTASSSESNTYKVKDTSTSTYWTGGGTGASIRMDLGALHSVATVELAVRNGTSRVQYFDIETSNDDENWMLVYRGQNDKTSNSLQSYDVPNVAARYVRIVGRGCSTDDDLSLSWIKIKGY